MNTKPISRRTFLQGASTVGVIGASQSLFPSWMPKLAFRPNFAPKNPGDTLVVISLRGGMDGLSAVAPYGDGSHYYDARPTLAIPENELLDLDGYFGLHPSMAALHDVFKEGDLAIVHASGLTDSTRSHFDAMRFMETAALGDRTVGTGWIGRHLQSASWQNDSPFRAVGMGSMVPTLLRGPVTPLAIKSITDFHFKGREDEATRLRQALGDLYTFGAPTDVLNKQADLVWDTIDVLQQLNATEYSAASGVVYPDSEFGMGLKQIAQLIKGGVGLEVATIDFGGWDTHEEQGSLGGEFDFLISEFSQGLAAFYADMRDHMDSISLVAISEFGRTIDENGSQGTDHGHGNAMFLMGGGFKGGQVYGEWPTLAPHMRDDSDDLAITTDYRDVLAEIMSKRIGNSDIATIFPNHKATPLGLVNSLF